MYSFVYTVCRSTLSYIGASFVCLPIWDWLNTMWR